MSSKYTAMIILHFHLSTVLAPLHELLSKDCQWTWDKRQVKAFNQAKDMLNSSDLVVHYDPSKELCSLLMSRLMDLERCSPISLMAKKNQSRMPRGHYHLPSEIMLS